MSEWEPATDAEVAMRDALRTDDQESYFRILSGVDLLLPVSADALAGLAPLGWGTWSTGGRTHVLAFTSSAALQSCLADYTGSARRVAYAELANTWPNLEWWLAVNPGLPIEGYLPAWFVAQLSRGDLRLPTRGPGRDKVAGPARIQDMHSAALAANAAVASRDEAERGYPQRPMSVPPAAATSIPQRLASAPSASAAGFAQRPMSAPPAAAAGYPQPTSAPPSAAGYAQPTSVPPAAAAGYPQPTIAPPSAAPGYPQPTGTPGAPAGYPQPTGASGAPAGYPQPTGAPGAPAGYPQPTGTPGAPAGYPQPTGAPAVAAGYPQSTSMAPAGYPQPTGSPSSGTAMPGYPQPTGAPGLGVPSAAAAAYPQPISAPPVTASPGGYSSPALSGPPGYAQAAAATRMPQFPAADEPQPEPKPEVTPAPAPTSAAPAPARAHAPASAAPASAAPGSAAPQIGPGGLPIRSPGGVLPSGLPSRAPAPGPASGPPAAPASASPMSGPPMSGPPMSGPQMSGPPMSGPPMSGPPMSAPPVSTRPMSAPPRSAPSGSAVSASAASAVPSAYRPPTVPTESTTGAWPTLRPGEDSRGRTQNPQGPLPVRTPMANTPPIPEHLSGQPVEEPPVDPRWSGAAASAVPPPAPALPELPRRQAPPPGNEPARGGFPQGPASPQAAAAQRVSDQPAPGIGSPLPRRQATAATEPAPMTSFPAFKTPAERAATAEAEAASPRPGLAPPVIPGAPGSDRPARLGAPQPPPLEVRGANPVRSAGPPPPSRPLVESFLPANAVERDLYDAADGGSTDHFLSTLLLATVLVPVANHSRPGSAPGESGFAFRTEQMDGEQFLVVFTSKDRLAAHYAEPTRTVSVRFYELIRNWPDPAWSFAVNPNSPVGAKYPGPQVIALANWATEAGLGSDPAEQSDEAGEPLPAPAPANDDAQHATVMQKTLPPEQVDYYLERGYDRVAGFVHRATEVEHLRTPAELLGALGLSYNGSSHQADAKEAYVLRWPAYRPSLYRIPYGGQNEQALKAMDGWVIERSPFRGNGFAPGEGRDVIAEFKVDSVRLPHGAQLWRLDTDGAEHMIAIFDNDGPAWRRVGEL